MDVSRAQQAPLVAALLCVATLLSACGGGGGSSGGAQNPSPQNPPVSPSPTPELVVHQLSISVERAVNEPGGSAVLNASIVNPTTEPVYFAYAYTEHAVDRVAVEWGNNGQLAVSVAFRAPFDLPLGEHGDVLLVALCEDMDCETVIEGTLIEVPIQYLVTLPAPGNEPVVAFENQSFTATGMIEGLSGGSQGPSSLFVPMQFMNFGDLTPRVTMTHSTNALIYGNVSWSGSENGATLSLRSPADLGLGEHHDTITIAVCLDDDCNYPAIGSPYTVTFDYTISDSETVSGEMGYSWTPVDFAPVGFVWDATAQRIFATRNVDDGQLNSQDGRLAAIDPESAAIDWEISLGARAEKLAVSDDGQFAYVVVTSGTGQIRKIRLTDRTPVATLELPDPAMTVPHLQVAPGTPNSVAVIGVVGDAYSLLFYADSSSMPSDRYDFAGRGISGTFGSDVGTFYAYDPNSDALHTFSPSGIELGDPSIQTVDLNATHPAWSTIRYQDGLLFESHGAVFDPTENEFVARMNLRTEFTQGDLGPDSSVVAAGAELGRAFYWYRDTGAVLLQAFDLQTELPLGYLATGSRMTFELIRWGDDGLAFVSSANTDRLILLRGNFVRPAP